MQLAWKLKNNEKHICLLWLGGYESDEAFEQMQYDIHKMELHTFVKIIPNRSNITDFYKMSDIVLVLSRDESFSLVTAEAGYMKKPVLCFDKSGGPPEIVNYDNRFIIPYGDIDALYKRILELLENDTEYRQMGEFLHERVSQNYTIEKVGPQILNQILETISNTEKYSN
jgi:glycosyltransferase involved in cell wall biosynthesis